MDLCGPYQTGRVPHMLLVGIDLVEVKRIKKSIQNPRFCERVFGPAERAFLQERGFSAHTCSQRFGKGLFCTERSCRTLRGNRCARFFSQGSRVVAREFGGAQPAFERASATHCLRAWFGVFCKCHPHKRVCICCGHWASVCGFLIFELGKI